jgi:hypothetical protein
MARRHRYGEASGKVNWRVNMTAAQLRAWLKTDESKKVGFLRRGESESESVGRQSARRIIAILEQGGPESDADFEHVRKVAGYNARHLAQRPAGDVSHTRWRYSLMNWGHDPLGRGRL